MDAEDVLARNWDRRTWTGWLIDDDDLMANTPLSNEAKAASIANELAFYLVNEIWVHLFPPRVNVAYLQE